VRNQNETRKIEKLFLAATRFSVAKSRFGGILIEIVRHYRTDRPTDIIWAPTSFVFHAKFHPLKGFLLLRAHHHPLF
jgi:hypothetical protein